MANITNNYETVMIFNTQAGEEGIKALYGKFRALIAENGTVDTEEDWGKRRLAYPIQDEFEGYYYLVRFTSGADFPAELDRVYKITDGVLRTLIVRIEPVVASPVAPVAAAVVAETEEVAAAETAEAAVEEETVTEAEVEVEAIAETETEAEAEAVAETETEAEAETETAAEAEAETGEEE